MLSPQSEAEIAERETKGKFRIPYVNSKFIFPGMLVLALAFSFTKYNKESIDFITNEKQINNPDEIIKSLNKIEIKKVQAYLDSDKQVDLKIKLDNIYLNGNVKYTKFIDGLPILESQKYLSGYKLFFTNLPFWVFLIVCVVMTFVSFTKNLSLIPLLGLISCCYLLTGMAVSNWMWFGVWLVIGLVIYFSFSYKNSKLNTETED
jgi:hypothetical protein